jgi:hypothetical protein
MGTADQSCTPVGRQRHAVAEIAAARLSAADELGTVLNEQSEGPPMASIRRRTDRPLHRQHERGWNCRRPRALT